MLYLLNTELQHRVFYIFLNINTVTKMLISKAVFGVFNSAATSDLAIKVLYSVTSCYGVEIVSFVILRCCSVISCSGVDYKQPF